MALRSHATNPLDPTIPGHLDQVTAAPVQAGSYAPENGARDVNVSGSVRVAPVSPDLVVAMNAFFAEPGQRGLVRQIPSN